jgi:oligoendopeptidase F
VPSERADIPARFKWNLAHIFKTWDQWQRAYADLDKRIDQYAALQGSLSKSPKQLLAALKLADDIGLLTYKVWYFAALHHDQDLRNSTIDAKRQQVKILFAKARQCSAWFNPELLQIPLETVRWWIAGNAELAIYRFALEDLYRQQAHVLDDKGEQLLSLSDHFSVSPLDAYLALSTADMKHPRVTLSTGEQVTLTFGQYRAILATNQNQADRALVFAEYHKLFESDVNTYAALYNSVLQRDWFHSRARGYRSALEAALHRDNIPTSVVENLIETTKARTEPLRRYHRLRKRVLGLNTYHTYDTTIPLVDFERTYPYNAALKWLPHSVAPLGATYQRQLRDVLFGDWIDVYENPGKRGGAYSAPVYGVHPYMLLNYNDTLDAVFTLAHEMGHSMHTLLSQTRQPFAYFAYTIFVAEVPSTLSEALLLEHMLSLATDDRERIVLLQRAIDGIVSTFYTQVLYTDFELRAHRLVESGQPVTADALSRIYFDLLRSYHGDALDYDEAARVTWARIPHFYESPYFVYQYSTCFASSAQLMKHLTDGSPAERAATVERYLTLLESGGSDHPMALLQRAGIDLSKPETVAAVSEQLDNLVTRLETELTCKP